MIRPFDDVLALGAITLGGGAAIALTAALLAARPHPSPPVAPSAPPAAEAPAPPPAPEPPGAPHFRPPVGHAPLPDLGRDRRAVRVTVIPDLRAETPGAIRFAVIGAAVEAVPADADPDRTPGSDDPGREPGGR